MGMSLLTGTITAAKVHKGAVQDQADEVASPPPAPAETPVQPQALPVLARAHFSDLISNWNDITQQVELSLPKAQMVIWTVIVLAVFIVKSFLLGALWPVPWELVALTGFSQAGYVGDKFVQSS